MRPRRGGLPPRKPIAVPPHAPNRHRPKPEAAKAGHKKRARTKAKRERFTVNSEDEGALPGERLTGETAVTLYDALHPDHGNVDEIAMWHNRLKKFYGRRVKVVANGERRDESGEKMSRIYIARVGVINSYADAFGNDGIYYRLMKAIFEADSDGEVVITSLTFELADDDDADVEHFGADADTIADDAE